MQQQLFGLEQVAGEVSGDNINREVVALAAVKHARGVEMDAAATEAGAVEPARWMEMDATAKEVDGAEPAWMEMDAPATEAGAVEPAWLEMDAAASEVDAAEPAWMDARVAEEPEPAGVLPALAMLWARFARKPVPRGPMAIDEQPPHDGGPLFMPLGALPHHGVMHDMPHDMPHGHGWAHRPGPMHGEPAVRRPSLLGPGPMPRMVGGQFLVQRRDGRWVPLADSLPGGQGGRAGRLRWL